MAMPALFHRLMTPLRWYWSWRRQLADARVIVASGLFDAEWYAARYPDAGAMPLRHYLRRGSAEGRMPCPFFDPADYRRRYPDVASAGMEPLVHYLTVGGREGRIPSPLFDGRRYLQTHQDVEASGMNPLVHYLRIGVAQGRDAPLPTA